MSLSNEQLRDLSRVIENHYETNRASEELMNLATEFAEKVQQRVQNSSSLLKGPLKGRTIMADIFGSLSNGLGTKDSDVDICLRIAGKKQPKGVKVIANYLKCIIEPLESLGCEVNTEALSAKVPVLTIKWRPPGRSDITLKGDITFYHAMSLHHAALIKAYCDWDPRVAKLGLFLKKWAKSSGVGSAKDGYLSSYCWSLLLIQYLQLVKPEVVPNLQKTTTPGKPREVKEGPFNVYFYRGQNPELITLQKQGYSSTSLAELFIGFLEYYRDYNFEKQKIAIDRDGRSMPQGVLSSRAIIISEPFTSMFAGLKHGGRNESWLFGAKKCLRSNQHNVRTYQYHPVLTIVNCSHEISGNSEQSAFIDWQQQRSLFEKLRRSHSPSLFYCKLQSAYDSYQRSSWAKLRFQAARSAVLPDLSKEELKKMRRN